MRKIVLMLFLVAAIGYVLTSNPAEKLADGTTPQQEVIFWGIYDIPELYEPAMSAFEKAHPDIKIVYKQFADAEEYQRVLLAQLEQDKGPDVFVFDGENQEQIQKYLAATRVEELSEFPPFVSQMFVRGSLQFAVPLWVDSLLIYYNKRYYRDGLKPLWHDFAKQTQEISIGGMAMGRLDNLHSGWDILKALLLQKQVKIGGKVQDNLYDTLEFFTRFANPGDAYFNWNENLSKNYPDKEIESFVRQKVGAIAGYSSLEPSFRIKLEQLSDKNIPHITSENIGVSLFPQFSIDQPRYLSKYSALGVSNASKHPEFAWEFVRLLTNRDNAAYYAQASGRTSGRLLPVMDGASEMEKIQRLQLPNAEVYPISPEVQEKLAQVIERANKKKTALREVLDMSF